jgi:thymidylate synthase (FAD)
MPESINITFSHAGYPCISSTSYVTDAGTPYLRAPGISLIAKPSFDVSTLQDFLGGYSDELEFRQYIQDPDTLADGAQLCKTAGQLCYMSFAPKRTLNKDAGRYFDNIRQSGHGSVLEHATYSFLFYGISRSVTHELVRHRAGFAFSQVSQRYCSGKIVRFVERPEYASDFELHRQFVERIDRSASEYEITVQELLKRQKDGAAILTADMKTDLRKKVQQAARSLLPNETEAPIIVSANARAWRHFMEMRASEHAEIEIRELAYRVYRCLVLVDNILFGDYEVKDLSDGTHALETPYSKV